MKKIHVLHVYRGLYNAGAENLILNIYKNFDRSKYQFDFIVHREVDSKILGLLKELGSNVYLITDFKLFNLIEYYKSWVIFFKTNTNFDIVHSHMGSTATIYLSIAKRFGLLTIAHSHSTKKVFNIKSILFSIFSFPTRYVSNYFLGCSNDASLSRYGKKIVNGDSYRLFYNSIEHDKFLFKNHVRKNVRVKLGLDKYKIIGHVGNFVNAKNHVFLVKTYYKIFKKRKDVKLVLVGDGVLKRSIEKLVFKLKMNTHVIFLGSRSDVYDLYNAFDIFVFPSKFEGLGMALVEAQFNGLTTVVSSQIPEEANISNRFIRLNDFTSTVWVKTIETLLINSRENSELSELSKKYYITNAVTSLDLIYAKLLKNKDVLLKQRNKK